MVTLEKVRNGEEWRGMEVERDVLKCCCVSSLFCGNCFVVYMLSSSSSSSASLCFFLTSLHYLIHLHRSRDRRVLVVHAND